MPKQFPRSNADFELNNLERQLAEAVEDKEQAERRYDALFLQVFHVFDKEIGEGAPATFICDDEFKLARIVPQMQPVINNEKLRSLIAERYSDEEARKLWNRISVPTRVVLQNKLAQELKRDKGLDEAIHKAGDIITTPIRKPSRIRTQASAKEIQALLNNAEAASEAEAAG